VTDVIVGTNELPNVVEPVLQLQHKIVPDSLSIENHHNEEERTAHGGTDGLEIAVACAPYHTITSL
jgi:hypothetical protein